MKKMLKNEYARIFLALVAVFFMVGMGMIGLIGFKEGVTFPQKVEAGGTLLFYWSILSSIIAAVLAIGLFVLKTLWESLKWVWIILKADIAWPWS